MKLYIKFDMNIACKVIMQEQLDKLEIPYQINGLSEIELKEIPTAEKYKELEASLKRYGIDIIDHPKSVLIQKIKDAIIEMVNMEEGQLTSNNSDYLVNKLNHGYGYLTNLFSEVTHITIEHFTIMQKIERVKQLLANEELTLTEIAWRLNYSSVAHLSSQFKKTTGLSPTAFQRIIKRRKNTEFVSES